MKIWIHGVTGYMGQELEKAIQKSKKYHFLGGSSSADSLPNVKNMILNADVVIDFSSKQGNDALWEYRDFLPDIVICTTGLESHQLSRWSQSHQKVLFAPNTSLGVFITNLLAKKAAKILSDDYDIEILETHHKRKKDAPSGTALHLAQSIASATLENHQVVCHRESPRKPREIGVSTLRGGGVFGEHEVRFLGEHDEIVISHKAYSRALFAQGALKLADWIFKQHEVKLYNLEDVSFS
ncbi:MAG: 4-hydroxy-tetrahydrodipicolinate reductase [Oligoflexales bacterium]